jgi:hypothetical protein
MIETQVHASKTELRESIEHTVEVQLELTNGYKTVPLAQVPILWIAESLVVVAGPNHEIRM